jgi:Type II secretion system (T2SS), protein E, N-terminal domain
MARVRIGELLKRRGRIDDLQLQSALAHQRRWGGRIGRAIVHLGFMDEPALMEAIGDQLGAPFVSLAERQVTREVLSLVPERLIRTRRVLPLARLATSRRGPLLVALADPADLGVLDEITFATGLDVKPVLAGEEDLDRAILRLLGGAARSSAGASRDANPLSGLGRGGHMVH